MLAQSYKPIINSNSAISHYRLLSDLRHLLTQAGEVSEFEVYVGALRTHIHLKFGPFHPCVSESGLRQCRMTSATMAATPTTAMMV